MRFPGQLSARIKNAEDLGDRLVRLTRALAVLPEGPRTVYLLHARDGVPFDAIAVRLGIERADVMAHLSYALVAISQSVASA